MSRRRKRARNAPLDPMNHDGRRPVPGFQERARQSLRESGTGRICGSVLALLALLASFAGVSADHVHTHVVTATRGVEQDAVATDVRSGGRYGPDYLQVALVDDPTLQTEVRGRPPGTHLGDVVRIRYDPHNPGRAVAPEAPSVDLRVVFVALVDVLLLAALAALAPPALAVLGERLGLWLRTRPRKDEPRERRRPLRAVGRLWRAVGDVASRQERARGLVYFVLFPVLLGGLGVAGTIPGVQRLVALEARALPGQATVVGSTWSHGGGEALQVRLTGGDEATVWHWEGVPRAGETIDVLYDPTDPSQVTVDGLHPWGEIEWSVAAAAVVGSLSTLVLAPAAVAGMVRRRGGPGDRAAPARRA